MQTQIVLLLLTFFVIVLVVLFLPDAPRALPRKRHAWRNSQGIQEIDVRIEGGYHPEVVIVEAGSPVRINFVRAEDLPSSGRVVFRGLGIDRHLPARDTTSVEFVPTEPGEYGFSCALGIYEGRLQVKPPRQHSA